MDHIKIINKPQQQTDHIFPISLAGGGMLLSLAVILIFASVGYLTTGLMVAAMVIVLSAVVFLYMMSRASKLASAQLFYSDLTLDIKTPQLVASLSKDIIIDANKIWKNLFDNLGSKPFEIIGDLKDSFHDQLSRNGKAEGALHLTDKEGRQRPYRITADFYSGSDDILVWKFVETISIDHVQYNSGDNIKNFATLLEKTDVGVFHLNEKGEIIFVSNNLQGWTNELERAGILELVKNNLSNAEETISYDLKGDVTLKLSNPEKNIYLAHKITISLKQKVKLSFNAKMEGFFLNSPMAIVVVNEQGNILESNPLFEKLLGRLEVENISNFPDLIEEENRAKIIREINKTIETGEKNRINQAKFKDGAEDSAEFYITRMEDFSTHGRVAVIYLDDTTEQKNLELQFAQSQKMQAVGQLAGGIAHDFNNLLTAILGFSDLLLVKHGPGDQSFADITQIKQNANRASNLVRQLLAFSRQQTLKPKVLDLTDVLAELSNLLRRLIGEKIELSLQHGRDLGSVKVDEGQFEQVVINLCVNARDAMPDGGSITISTRDISRKDSKAISKRHKVMPVGDYVLLQIKDTGTGIPLKIQGKIFEPFFSTKEVGKGTGLGLSTVYGIVKQTGGFIFLDSEDNVGTTFNIYLPLYKTSKKTEVKKIEEAPKKKKLQDLTGRETLLLVEDEDAVRMFAVRALKNKGYNMLEADCGETAIQLISELPDDVTIDLVISDVVMPIMDGPTMVRKLKEDDPDLKVIFISGYAEDAFDSDLDGDFNFLPKPFSLTELAEKVREVLSE